MKKSYNGVLYDTDKSKLISEFESSYSSRDTRYYKEALYRSTENKYFLYGHGNEDSKYAKRIRGSHSSDGRFPQIFWYYRSWSNCSDCIDIIPLSCNEAKKWYENKLNEVYRCYDIVKAKLKVPPTYRIPVFIGIGYADPNEIILEQNAADLEKQLHYGRWK